MKPTIVTLVLSAAAVLGYVAYRVTLDAPDTASGTPSAAPADAELPDELPRFTLADLEGTDRALTSFAGEPLVINFWATWCAPCRREIPRLKEFKIANEGFEVIGIAVDYRDAVLEYAEEMEFNYPVLVGQSDAMNAAAGFGVDVLALPFTVFTDADGAVLGVHTGEVHPMHLDNYAAVIADLDAGTIDRAAARKRLARTM